MSKPIDIPKKTKKEYPYIELTCSFCPNKINVPGSSYTSCAGCKNRICESCAPEMKAKYGNKYIMVSEYYVNNCDHCDPDYNLSLSEVSSDDDSVYEDKYPNSI